MAREDQSEGIVLAIGCIGELDLSEQGCEEGARGTKAIDAQGIVRPVLVCPLLMVDESWRQGVQLEVAHPVGAYDHSGILFVEGLHHLLQGLRRGIEVVGVELYGKASAAVIIDGDIPAAADTQVSALRNNMYQPFVVQTVQQLCRTVCRVIIDHNDIELEVGLLPECTAYGIEDGLLAVIDWDDDRSLDLEVLFVEIWSAIERRVYLGSDGSQMGSGGMLHLYLYLAVAGIHVVELLDTRSPQVSLLLGIECLVEVEYLSLAAQEETQRIESGILVVVLAGLHCKGMQQRCLDEQATEVKVIANAALEIVDGRMSFHYPRTVLLSPLVMVGIDHRSIRVGSDTQHAVEGTFPQRKAGRPGYQQYEIGLGILGNTHQCITARQVLY